jgi:glycosyltransferase involved in cell wall biosynthesis
VAKALLRDKDTVLIYHHSVYWVKGEDLLGAARGKVILRYHNITPVRFFKDYNDKVATYATEHGIMQTERFVKSKLIHHYLGASKFNCEELIALGAPRNQCSDIAPFHALDEYERASISLTLREKIKKDVVNVMFVGRTVPNKGHIHMLEVLNSYIDMFDAKIQLNIVGNLRTAPRAYLQRIKSLVRKYRLGDHVRFWGGLSLNDVHTMFLESDVFLLMSEHEGFCVPIIEAQHHKLPIVALGRTAIPETLGANQLCFETLNYDLFAAAIHEVATNKEVSSWLGEEGYKNQKRYALRNLETQFGQLLENINGNATEETKLGLAKS